MKNWTMTFRAVFATRSHRLHYAINLAEDCKFGPVRQVRWLGASCILHFSSGREAE
ncbi:hypothetical protein DPMN_187326 [Dreissena polymorpha]|uniref:Uncharacterized protein n=1 Tax=Dreissena polymorpha TaxID=45954 RepID=A0A9D4DQC5_DREPO|nr:hypothetical protein DPMN_187326 [Dreissena polymorpha]